MIEIILESFNSLFKSLDLFLQTKDLTLGAILAGVTPFIVIYIKLSKEKEKKARSLLIERRQMQIAFNINEIMEALKVESKWSIQEIGSTHTVQPVRRKLFSFLQAVTKHQKRRMIMNKLKSRKFWLTVLAALIPVINTEFNIHLDFNTMVLMATTIMGGVAALAHVDAKKLVAKIAHTSPNVLIDMTFTEAIPILKTIHDGVNDLLADVKKDDGSQTFKDAMKAYSDIMAIIEANKHPEPVPTITEDQVA